MGKDSPLKTYYMMQPVVFYSKERLSLWSTRLVFCGYYLGLVAKAVVFKYLISGKFDLTKAAMWGLWWNVIHCTER